jgi:hypothetical protein
MGEVGRPPPAVTFQAVVSALRFFAVIGEPVARREFEGSWSGYGHDAARVSASGGTGSGAVAAPAAEMAVPTNTRATMPADRHFHRGASALIVALCMSAWRPTRSDQRLRRR